MLRPTVLAASVVLAGSLWAPTATAAPPAPVIVGVSADGPTGLNVKWRPGGAMPVGYYAYQVGLPDRPHWGPMGSTDQLSATVDIGAGPGIVRLWTEADSTSPPSVPVYASLYRTRLLSRIPAAAAYGRPTVVTGTVDVVVRHCDTQSCRPHPFDDPNRLLLLQARQGTGAWATVTSTRTGSAGEYRFSVTTPGTRQYRVVAPTATVIGNGTNAVARTGAVGPAVTTTARFTVLGAKFLTPTVAYGQQAKAYLKVAPAVDGRVLLQRRTGTSWANVSWVPLKDGVAVQSFASRIRGQVGYRFYLPAASYAGRSIAATLTPTFVLTTR